MLVGWVMGRAGRVIVSGAGERGVGNEACVTPSGREVGMFVGMSCRRRRARYRWCWMTEAPSRRIGAIFIGAVWRYSMESLKM